MPTLDEQVRWTAFGLLVRHGRAVEVTDLAGVMPSGADPEAVREAVSRLGAGGQIDIGQGGAVIGAIAGGGKGLAIGAGVGALTGAIAGRVKKGHEVKVKSGTEFGVILNRAFSLPAYKAA